MFIELTVNIMGVASRYADKSPAATPEVRSMD
jgi:hypothetical protein